MEKLQWNRITSENRIPKTKNKNTNLSINYRSEIESDYLRIIRSPSFRRLQDKTQVFPLDKSDFVRTRLTHSLEVAAIAKVMAKQICTKIEQVEKDPNNLPDAFKVVEIVNCAGLLHDIGNPPFGHFGETAIRNWFVKHLPDILKQTNSKFTTEQIQDLYYYEGNAQALRIVSKLHKLTGKNGMHLTAAVLDTIIKYPCDAKQFQEELKKEQRSLFRKKLGYFQSEKELYQNIKAETGCMDCRNPLTFILEAADDLAYTFADLEDGYKKGLYTYQELKDWIKKVDREEECKRLEDEFEKATEEYESIQDAYKQAVFCFLNIKQLQSISSCRDAFIENYEDIMHGKFEKELIASSKEASLIHGLKDFAKKYIYHIPNNIKLDLMGNEIITFLMDRFMDALVIYDTKQEMTMVQSMYIQMLSKNYLETYKNQAQYVQSESEKLYLRLLLGCDYIAGMSDGYATLLYKELKGIA